MALDFLLAPTRELAVVAGDSRADFDAVLDAASLRLLPHAVIAPAPAEDREALAHLVPLLKDRPPIGDRVTLYDCRNRTCLAPASGAAEVVAALGEPKSG